MNSLATIWNTVLEYLSKNQSYAFNMLRDLRLVDYNSETRVYTFEANPFVSAWLDGNENILRDALKHALGDSSVDFVLKDETSVIEVEKEPVPAPEEKPVPAEKKRVPEEEHQLPTTINPNNTFDNFIVGPENELACATSQALAKELYDRSGMNPLFIYGPSGIGKTHLLHAIANQVFKEHPDARIRYVSGETFTNDYIDAVINHSIDNFRAYYRRLNLLLIDDIQFIAGKEGTMNEFFHTFNTLSLNGCKIVLTCDREASAMDLEDRLISRFKQGITADIHPPREIVRAAILKKKAEQRNFNFFPRFKEAFDFITQKITRNVRNIEGALNTLIQYIRLRKVETLTQNQLQEVLGTFVSSDATSAIGIKNIQDEVAKFYKLSVEDLCGKSRTANITYARQVAMFLCLELAKVTQSAVGMAFGGRDHGTVINARKKVSDIVETDATRRKELEALRIRLRR